VVNRVDETRSDPDRHDAVRDDARIVNRGSQRVEIALSKRFVDPPDLSRVIAPRIL
jgi:hypothetical protein